MLELDPDRGLERDVLLDVADRPVLALDADADAGLHGPRVVAREPARVGTALSLIAAVPMAVIATRTSLSLAVNSSSGGSVTNSAMGPRSAHRGLVVLQRLTDLLAARDWQDGRLCSVWFLRLGSVTPWPLW